MLCFINRFKIYRYFLTQYAFRSGLFAIFVRIKGWYLRQIKYTIDNDIFEEKLQDKYNTKYTESLRVSLTCHHQLSRVIVLTPCGMILGMTWYENIKTVNDDLNTGR